MTEAPPSAGSVSDDADAMLAAEASQDADYSFGGAEAKSWRMQSGPIPHLETNAIGVGDAVSAGQCTGGHVAAIYVTTLGVIIIVTMPNGDQVEVLAIGSGSAVLA